MHIHKASFRLAFSMACCPCSRDWGCRMLSATCTPKQRSSPTQPPQALHRPGLTDGLSLTACFQISAQLQYQTSGHYGVSLSTSPAAAPPRGPGVWAMPPIITHPAFKTLMTAQIQAFMLACPLSAAVSRAPSCPFFFFKLPCQAKQTFTEF